MVNRNVVSSSRLDEDMLLYPVSIQPDLLTRTEEYLAMVGTEWVQPMKREDTNVQSLLVRTGKRSRSG